MEVEVWREGGEGGGYIIVIDLIQKEKEKEKINKAAP
jgi:hypothetical protein